MLARRFFSKLLSAETRTIAVGIEKKSSERLFSKKDLLQTPEIQCNGACATCICGKKLMKKLKMTP